MNEIKSALTIAIIATICVLIMFLTVVGVHYNKFRLQVEACIQHPTLEFCKEIKQ